MFSNVFHNQTQPQTSHMILSQNISMSMDTRATRRNCNTLVFGTNADRVRESYLLPNLRQCNSSYVVFDKDGILQRETEQMFRDNGYQVKCLNLAHPEASDHYNPFAYIRNDDDVVSFVNAIIEGLDKKTTVHNNPMMRSARRALLQAIAFFIIKECIEDDWTLESMEKCLRVAAESPLTLDIMFEDIEKSDLEHLALQNYRVFTEFRSQSPEAAMSVAFDAWCEFCRFRIKEYAELTKTNEIYIPSIGLAPTVLYVRPDPAAVSYNTIPPVFFTQLFDALYRTAETQPDGKLPCHVRIMLDAFGSNVCPNIPDIVRKLSTMRPYNISCNMIVNDDEQFRESYKDDWQIICGNCDETIYFAEEEGKVPEHLARFIRANAEEAPSCDLEKTKKLFTISRREEVYPASGKHLANLVPGNCLVIVRGYTPVIDKACTPKKT